MVPPLVLLGLTTDSSSRSGADCAHTATDCAQLACRSGTLNPPWLSLGWVGWNHCDWNHICWHECISDGTKGP